MPWVACNNRHTTNWQVGLKVIAYEDFCESSSSFSHCCLVNELDFQELCEMQPTGTEVLLFARTYPQFVLKAQFHPNVPRESIILNQAQRLNFEVTVGEELFNWSVYNEHVEPLADLVLEINPCDSVVGETLDRGALQKSVGKLLWKLVATLHERILLNLDNRNFILRVKDLQVEADPEGDTEDITIPDTFRGKVETTTVIILEKARSGEFEFCGPETKRVENIQRNVIDVYCNDGNWFPVKKRLLQPSVFLAKQVLSKDRVRVDVDLDCCTFDKVLLYLEAEAKGDASYTVELTETEQMLEAAKKLQIIGLTRLCEKVMGEYSSQIRTDGISWEEVKERNANGELLLIIDFQVVDVTKWLDLHPGGNTIIPEQALNCDATVLFEIYHASRDSFLYLKQLYIGFLQPEDQDLVPLPKEYLGQQTRPSEEFLEQLREYMNAPAFKVFKSF